MTHICFGKLIIIGSDNGLSPWRRQAIIWTNAGIWSMGPLGTNFSEILIEIHTFSFQKMHLKMSSAKWRLFCLCLNVLTQWNLKLHTCKMNTFNILKWISCLKLCAAVRLTFKVLDLLIWRTQIWSASKSLLKKVWILPCSMMSLPSWCE